MCLFLSIFGPVRMPELWGGVGYNRYAALPRFQPLTVASPALGSGCPTRIHFSPTRQSNMHDNEKGLVIGYIGKKTGNERRTDTGGTN